MNAFYKKTKKQKQKPTPPKKNPVYLCDIQCTYIKDTPILSIMYTVTAIVYKNQSGKDNNTLVHVDLFSMYL